MAELVGDCPRCRSARITFDVLAAKIIGMEYGWQQWYEAFSVCRHCSRSTVFVLSDDSPSATDAINRVGLPSVSGVLNYFVKIERFVSQRDAAGVEPPEHLPDSIRKAFVEGATCFAVGCPNAAATMFRLSVDLATRALLPEVDVEGLNSKTRRDLGLRLPWLFDHGRLPAALRELSSCIKEDGNDGAHIGSLTKEDAEDVLDFTKSLLERMYTEPERLNLAKARRAERRSAPAKEK